MTVDDVKTELELEKSNVQHKIQLLVNEVGCLDRVIAFIDGWRKEEERDAREKGGAK